MVGDYQRRRSTATSSSRAPRRSPISSTASTRRPGAGPAAQRDPVPRAAAAARRDAGAADRGAGRRGCRSRSTRPTTTIGAFAAARALGYAGVSAKSCKGFYRALLNRARVAKWNAEAGAERYFMSAEDLTTQARHRASSRIWCWRRWSAPTHVERNGHHYVDGMAGAPEGEQRAFLAAHGDLYRDDAGRARLAIRDGALSLGSVLAAPGPRVGGRTGLVGDDADERKSREENDHDRRRPVDQPRHRARAMGLRRGRGRLPAPRHHHDLPLARAGRRDRPGRGGAHRARQRPAS